MQRVLEDEGGERPDKLILPQVTYRDKASMDFRYFSHGKLIRRLLPGTRLYGQLKSLTLGSFGVAVKGIATRNKDATRTLLVTRPIRVRTSAKHQVLVTHPLTSGKQCDAQLAPRGEAY